MVQKPLLAARVHVKAEGRTLRLYGAQPGILDGAYRLPAVQKVS